MKTDMLRNAISIIVGFIILWYCRAMFNFFPFSGNDFAVKAIGFTGLLICIVLVVCTYWIISEININCKSKLNSKKSSHTIFCI